jgi:predicted ArsR family transcriptional regulator
MNPKGRRSFLVQITVGAAGSSTVLAQQSANYEEQRLKQQLDACRIGAFRNRMSELAYRLNPLLERFGPEVLEVLRQTTIERATREYEQAKVEKRDLDAMKSLLWDRLGPPVFVYELLEKTEETMRFRVSHCGVAEEMRKNGAPEVGFALFCASDYGYCQGLNPSIKFTRTKTLMQGDDHCDHAYELKKT